jgi:hypothetical protein
VNVEARKELPLSEDKISCFICVLHCIGQINTFKMSNFAIGYQKVDELHPYFLNIKNSYANRTQIL